MNIWILFLAAAAVGVAVAAFVWTRRSDAVTEKYHDDYAATGLEKPIEVTRNTPPKRKKHFYGVSVRPGVNCCDAAKTIARNRYLQGEAPQFPLSDCDRDDCRCVMYPEDDRRTDIDRREDAFAAYGDYRGGWHPRRRHEGPDRRKP
ncbi:MAG: hypothetical protein ACE5G3_07590 [Gammaproteobacteria bacterium]